MLIITIIVFIIQFAFISFCDGFKVAVIVSLVEIAIFALYAFYIYLKETYFN